MSSSRRNSLSPPERQDAADPGARDLAEASDSEEHYSDAQSKAEASARASPVPRTRVERVDDRPAYGEVPGTAAYTLREGDAEPDEIAIIPDPEDPSNALTSSESEGNEPASTPGGRPIPKTVVEETPDGEGSVTHPENRQRRLSDARPDVVVKADGKVEENGAANDSPVSPSLSTPTAPTTRRSSLAAKQSPLSLDLARPESAVEDEDDDDDEEGEDEDGDGDQDNDFGDDFDDFEEGDEDSDFGDFDEGFQTPAQQPQPSNPAIAASSLPFVIPNFEDLSPPEVISATEPYLAALFPSPESTPTLLPTPSAKENPIFLTQRSASLWSQLVAPPPLQPPDWIRSRIRRLFLVSLGVPVDLDEILPASSKQKKLVLPSLHRTTSTGSLRSRVSSDSRGVRGGDGADKQSRRKDSGTSSSREPSSSKRAKRAEAGAGTGTGTRTSSAAHGTSPERLFDSAAALRECSLTDAALDGMTDAELLAHVKRLETMQEKAHTVLAYWQRRTDEKIGDREAFEGVIENLVKHARKVRK
ncbi:uncharacterized protein C8A04DRAFT_38992 [Dichotomopilus funicola]|uniref:Uncharacterized protein n=1 Tax=Dichotomopilus funicola TaxID=1934379 RepID=A0AAN6V145_9PEZI|nr:hypothetical protein C8A04DRAFT_38992 [Dichotomopilus funicola]